jgi:DNA-binding response OmpR family regulator
MNWRATVGGIGAGEFILEELSRSTKSNYPKSNYLGHRGWQLATLAREINPELPVVYMTAASAAEWAAHGVPNSILLQKPFAPAQLVTAVSQLLNKGTPAT